MKTSPLISVIVPVYNGERYLKDTLQSIICQTYQELEIIVINDGSADRTEQIIHDLASIDDRILYYLRPNSGVSSSRNFGLKKAKGEFVVFFDADDIMLNDFLSSRLEFLKTNASIGLCGSKIKIIDENENIIESTSSAPGINMLEDILLYKNGIATVPSNIMHRRKLLDDYGIYFDERLNTTADRLFLCKLALVTQAYCLPAKNFCYRIHTNSMYNDPAKKRYIFIDTVRFIKILLNENLVPENIRITFKEKNYYMLAGAAWKANFFTSAFLYGFQYYWIKSKRLIKK